MVDRRGERGATVEPRGDKGETVDPRGEDNGVFENNGKLVDVGRGDKGGLRG